MIHNNKRAIIIQCGESHDLIKFQGIKSIAQRPPTSTQGEGGKLGLGVFNPTKPINLP